MCIYMTCDVGANGFVITCLGECMFGVQAEHQCIGAGLCRSMSTKVVRHNVMCDVL